MFTRWYTLNKKQKDLLKPLNIFQILDYAKSETKLNAYNKTDVIQYIEMKMNI